LKDFQVFEIEKQFLKIKELEKRKSSIIKTIKELGQLNNELENKIQTCWDEKLLEDLYLPFKPKRKTKAEKAREQGLEGLAKIIMSQKNQSFSVHSFCRNGITELDAIEGAKDIMAEWISERSFIRNKVRFEYQKEAVLESKIKKGKEVEGDKYQDYFKFSSLAKKIPSHRVLAILRGEKEKVLSVSLKVNKNYIVDFIQSKIVKGNGRASEIVKEACEEAYKRLLKPSIESEILNDLKQIADLDSIKVFSSNLKQLLMIPPLGAKNILAIDPGFKTGCKLVCLDNQGNLTHNETIFPHPPQKNFKESLTKISSLVNAYKIDAIAIGNGTASRETENLVKKVHFSKEVDVFVVSESGASIYSASKVGREEFPNHDVTVRGAVSIGRRLLDPLAELVKIDPKSIGVGQYQHDVNQSMLKQELDHVVELCVNAVGVNVNTASPHLLKYVSGIGETIAQNIVDYRKSHGDFINREELQKVPRLGGKAFEQSAGFLRIPKGDNPLDNSGVHPERYAVVNEMAKRLKLSVGELIGNDNELKKLSSNDFGLGEFTFSDIISELIKPGHDPRKKVRKFEFDRSIESISDVKEGMELPGLVENITNFGAFVNIGIKEKGLIHLSEMANEFVSNPHDYLSLNDFVRAKVISVDFERKRIGLSLKAIRVIS